MGLDHSSARRLEGGFAQFNTNLFSRRKLVYLELTSHVCSLYHNHTRTRLSPTRPSPAFHCSIHHVLSFPPLPPQALTSPAAAAGRVGPSFAAGEEEEEEVGGGWQPRCPRVTKHLSDKWVQRERRSILVLLNACAIVTCPQGASSRLRRLLPLTLRAERLREGPRHTSKTAFGRRCLPARRH